MAPKTKDNEYKDATQAVVDDAMRTDTLGPKVSLIIKEHKPTNDAIKEIIAEAITKEPNVQLAIQDIITNSNHKSKSVWIDRIIGAAWGIVLIIAGAIIKSLIK